MKQALLLLLLVLSLSGCRVPGELSQEDLNSLYDPAVRHTLVEGQAIHLNDSVTDVRLSLKLQDFTYQRARPGAVPMARIMLRYTLSDSYETHVIQHKDSVFLTDSLFMNREKTVSYDFLVPLKNKGEFLFSATITDVNKGNESRFFLTLNKGGINKRENFFLSRDDQQMINGDHVAAGTAFFIESYVNEGPVLYARYYNRKFPISTPPFVSDNGAPFNYKADSTFRLDFNHGSSELLRLEKNGFYHFQADTTTKDGFTVFVTDPDFPALSLPEHILEPLKYITSSREYEQLASYENKKLAVDSFWLVHAGMETRAKTLIYRYYNRVQEANILFTSYLEGWKTDRGMIYIIFGPPNHVFREANVENWTYGELMRPQSLRFSFVRVNNPFTNNDFSLIRNPQYKDFWYNSVEVWRR